MTLPMTGPTASTTTRPPGHDVMLDDSAGGARHLGLDWVRRTPR
ncbi:MAG: hypothetical protein U5K30_08880 [Acidimicrobiales bacterium]|nr:hypothetical protein [Acidimicrobiales bacterium]